MIFLKRFSLFFLAFLMTGGITNQAVGEGPSLEEAVHFFDPTYLPTNGVRVQLGYFNGMQETLFRNARTPEVKRLLMRALPLQVACPRQMFTVAEASHDPELQKLARRILTECLEGKTPEFDSKAPNGRRMQTPSPTSRWVYAYKCLKENPIAEPTAALLLGRLLADLPPPDGEIASVVFDTEGVNPFELDYHARVAEAFLTAKYGQKQYRLLQNRKHAANISPLYFSGINTHLKPLLLTLKRFLVTDEKLYPLLIDSVGPTGFVDDKAILFTASRYLNQTIIYRLRKNSSDKQARLELIYEAQNLLRDVERTEIPKARAEMYDALLNGLTEAKTLENWTALFKSIRTEFATVLPGEVSGLPWAYKNREAEINHLRPLQMPDFTCALLVYHQEMEEFISTLAEQFNLDRSMSTKLNDWQRRVSKLPHDWVVSQTARDVDDIFLFNLLVPAGRTVIASLLEKWSLGNLASEVLTDEKEEALGASGILAATEYTGKLIDPNSPNLLLHQTLYYEPVYPIGLNGPAVGHEASHASDKEMDQRMQDFYPLISERARLKNRLDLWDFAEPNGMRLSKIRLQQKMKSLEDLIRPSVTQRMVMDSETSAYGVEGQIVKEMIALNDCYRDFLQNHIDRRLYHPLEVTPDWIAAHYKIDLDHLRVGSLLPPQR